MSLANESSTPPILLPCNICNRTFKPESLAKHSKFCEKSLMKKRKKFDSSKQRIQGTELAEFLPILSKSVRVDKSPVRKADSSWKEKHLELMQTIKAARQSSPDSGKNYFGRDRARKLTDQENCPHCDRSFGPKAYDRHIEWCKDKNSRILPKSTASVVAKERLEARTKYQAPRLRQSLRARTREKYSPQRLRQSIDKKQGQTDNSANKESVCVLPSNKETLKTTVPVKLQNSIQKPKDITKQVYQNNKTTPNLSSQSFTKRPAINNRLGPSQLKKLETSLNNSVKSSSKPLQKQTTDTKTAQDGDSDVVNYDPYSSAERQMKELLGLDFDKEYPKTKKLPSPLLNSISSNRKLKPETEANKLVNNSKSGLVLDFSVAKVNNAVDEKNSLNSRLSSLNTGSISQKQSIDLKLIRSKIEDLDFETLSDDEVVVPFNDLVIKDPLETELNRTPVSIGSPTSAFAKYSPSPPLSIDENSIEVLNNLSDNKIHNDSSFENSDKTGDKYPQVNMSNISLCSTISLDSNIDFNKNKRGSNENTFVPDITRRVSKQSETHKEGRNAGRALLNMEQMLFGISSNSGNKSSSTDNKNNNKALRKNVSSSNIQNKTPNAKTKKSEPNFNRLYPKLNIDSTAAAELELVESISELENMYLFFPISQEPNPSLNTPVPKTNPSLLDGSGEGVTKERKEVQNAPSIPVRKPSSDSAYNSLNRRSPLTKAVVTHQIDVSDFKSPSSLSSSGSESSVAQGCRTERRLSTFCHECGAKYPVSIAKFCCECGVRRLALS